MKKYSEMSTYEKEILTALYKALDFMQCYDLPTAETLQALASIESKYEE